MSCSKNWILIKRIKAFVVITSSLLSFQCLAQEYPREIIQTGKQNLYDKAKYFLYCTQGPLKLKFAEPSKKKLNVTCGTLPLKFDHLEVRGDTVEIDFFFYYRNKRVDGRLVDDLPLWGVVYVGNSDKIILLSSRSEVRYFGYTCIDEKKGCKGFEDYLNTPSNIKYIKQNKNKLDPWFRQEAIKRGVIK